MKWRLLILIFIINSICHADTAFLKNKTDKTIEFILNSSAVPGCHARNPLKGCLQSGGFRVKVGPQSEKIFRFRDKSLPCTRATCFGCIGAEIIVDPNKVLFASLDLVKGGANKFLELTGEGLVKAIHTTSQKDIWWQGPSKNLISGLVIASGTLGGIGSGISEAFKMQCMPIEVIVSQIAGSEGKSLSDYKIDIKQKEEIKDIKQKEKPKNS